MVRFENAPVQTRRSNFYFFHGEIKSLPVDCVPITVFKQSEKTLYGETDMNLVREITQDRFASWESYLRSLHPHVQEILKYANITNAGYDIATSIRARTAIAVSDASVKKSSNTSAILWIITNKSETFQSSGDSGCPSFHQALDSYTSESFGILILLTVVKTVCDFYKVRTGGLIVACDNDSILEKCIRNDYRANATEKHFDMVWAMFDIRKALRIKILHKYVSGHQDK